MNKTIFTPTRAAGLERTEAYAPFMGRHYAARRNFDLGPQDRSTSSQLSPWLRRRLVTEQEVVAAALGQQSLHDAEKFVQEVVWRTYFKGWLERRPLVWSAYLSDLERLRAGKEPFGLGMAVEGATGIDCFDHWANELVENGYLHNHARLWFASIWIFTLRLPWQLGADFFLRHLLDGDPASNTLSWRWVAGLHTRGKNYAAVAWNIEKFTQGRFAPDPGELEQNPVALEETFDPGSAQPLRIATKLDPAKATALLLTVEDCHPEDFDLPASMTENAVALDIGVSGAAPAVRTFDRVALDDMIGRVAPGAPVFADAKALIDWAREKQFTQLVTPFIPVGPVRDHLDAAEPALKAAGMTLAEVQRDWDAVIWPHATAGFFKVKKQIPRIVEQFFPEWSAEADPAHWVY